MSIYLDYNASAPIDSRVVDEIVEVYRSIIGNADSRTHEYGNEARTVVEEARNLVASIINVNEDEIFFTSGATESNNIAIQGLRKYGFESGKKHIITTAIEHKSVLETCRAMEENGFEVDYIKPDASGRVSAEEVISKIRDDTLLVSVMHVNNETGIIQPVKEIGDYIAEKDVLFHLDATQSFGKLVDELKVIKYDMLSMSAHKIYGPQGVGALVLRKKHYRLPPVKNVYYGGQQERGIRPGTMPVALIAGLGKACQIAEKEYKNEAQKAKRIKQTVLELLDSSGLSYGINGDPSYSVDTTLSVHIDGVSSEALMLSAIQFCSVSNGSACNSNSYNPSYVLKAMSLEEDVIRSSVRISWGRGTDLKECKSSLADLLDKAKSMV